VCERILEVIRDGSYEEEELMTHFLDEEACAAVAKGKEQLARERAAASGFEPP